MKQSIRYAEPDDLSGISYADWLGKERLEEKIERREIFVFSDGDQITGILRFNWFGDYLPFINFLWVEEGFQREGRGSRLIGKLEEETRAKNYAMILASTQSNKTDQEFFRKVGFEDIGSFSVRAEPSELIMVKYLLGQ